jgi:hypothetical protein
MSFPSAGQDSDRKLTSIENKCKQSWQYFNSSDTTYGIVLFHAKADFLCGGIASASLTVIKTTTGDTIRVLQMCNTNQIFFKSEYVKVSSMQQPTCGVFLPFDKYFDCVVKKTCYGVIKKAD